MPQSTFVPPPKSAMLGQQSCDSLWRLYPASVRQKVWSSVSAKLGQRGLRGKRGEQRGGRRGCSKASGAQFQKFTMESGAQK